MENGVNKRKAERRKGEKLFFSTAAAYKDFFVCAVMVHHY